ncbi:cyclin-dependent kinase 4 inhibitor B-like [Hyperolius riggenbachi]|uniref:cyclin-dependent kinase 4 inhibitor B-like n=1 Tax=Hyperolius riggenbachi TaxID=752182 RepID=UPI0035A34BD4
MGEGVRLQAQHVAGVNGAAQCSCGKGVSARKQQQPSHPPPTTLYRVPAEAITVPGRMMQARIDSLSAAAARGDVEAARELLQMKVPVNAANSDGKTAIQVMMKSSPKMAMLLLEYRADPNIRDSGTGRSIVHDVACEGCMDTLIVLLDGGADINIKDKGGFLPMELAPESIVADLQTMGILSAKKQLVMQDTMGR